MAWSLEFDQEDAELWRTCWQTTTDNNDDEMKRNPIARFFSGGIGDDFDFNSKAFRFNSKIREREKLTPFKQASGARKSLASSQFG